MPVCAVLEEDLHHSCVTILRSQPQRLVANCVHICAVLDEMLQDVCMATVRCPPQRHIVLSVHICARTKKQFNCQDVPASGCPAQGFVNNASLVLVLGLQQRRAVLVHAGSHHGADDGHVAKRSSTLQATAVLEELDVGS